GVIVRLLHRADLRKPESPPGIYHSRIDRQPLAVDPNGLCRHLYISADGHDSVVPDHQRTALDGAVRHRDDARILQCKNPALGTITSPREADLYEGQKQNE